MSDPQISLLVIVIYLVLLLALGVGTSMLSRGTAKDFFIASHSIGPFLLLMSVFGTTMTAFAMVGSTGKAFDKGIGVYGLMASWSGLIHSAVFFLVGIKVWAIGKRNGYITQCQLLRERFESPALGYVVFPILVGLVIPYLLIGLLGAGSVMRGLTIGTFNDLFPGVANPTTGRMMFVGAIPPWITGLVISLVVLFYVFLGGVRSTAWANAFQTIVFMTTGVVAFIMIARQFGGMTAASRAVLENSPQHLSRAGMMGKLEFFTYFLVPLSVGAFPHLVQHWLTARSAKTFRLTVIMHPIFIMIVWVPCILMGIWAAGAGIAAPGGNSNAILGKLVGELVHNPWLTGLLVAGVLAAIMSSLDSQFMCLGAMFTNDVVFRIRSEDSYTDKQKILMARGFIVCIVLATYLLTFFPPPRIFDLGIWCFSGFASLFPLIVAAIYWRRATKAGAIASVLVTAVTWGFLFTRAMLSGGAHGGEEEPLIYGMMPVTFIFAASAISLIVVSLLTRPPSQRTLRKFFALAQREGI
jgi:SSS family solute:Na+ symporter